MVDCSPQELLENSTLDVDSSIICWTTRKHRRLVLIFYFVAPIYIVGIPFGIFFFIWNNVVKEGKWYDRKSKIRFGYFYQKFKQLAWYWEAVFMARKLAVPVLKMFTDSISVLLQISGSFVVFLVFAVLHNIVQPFIEKEFNFCDTVALSAHVFVMFTGAIYQTGRLGSGSVLSSAYAYLFIGVNSVVGLYLFAVVVREVRQSLPLIDMILSGNFWIDKVWPYVHSALRYRMFQNHKVKLSYLKSWKTLKECFHAHDEMTHRSMLVESLKRNPLLSDVGLKAATEWIEDFETSSIRDAYMFCRFLSKMKAEIDRSVFIYLVSGAHIDFEVANEYQNHLSVDKNRKEGRGKYDKWLSSLGVSLRIMMKHHENNTKLLSSYGIASGICSLNEHKMLVSIGCVDVEKLCRPFLMLSSSIPTVFRSTGHGYEDLPFRPYVDFFNDGNYHMCCIDDMTSLSDISVTLCHPFPGEYKRLVNVLSLRVYSRVNIKRQDGLFWPGEIVVAQRDGKYLVRAESHDLDHGNKDMCHHDATVVSHCDLTPIHSRLDKPVGYVWQSYCEEEDEIEIKELRREDHVLPNPSSLVSFNSFTGTHQLEFLQSRFALSSATTSGGKYSPYTITAVGFCDGTCDVWSLEGRKLFTLVHWHPAQEASSGPYRMQQHVSTVWISPNGELIVTMSEEYLCYWSIPKDPEFSTPSRLPIQGREGYSQPQGNGNFDVNSIVSQQNWRGTSEIVFSAYERKQTELVLPEKLKKCTVLKVAKASKGNVTDIWVVASDAEKVYLFNVSQSRGIRQATRLNGTDCEWPHEENKQSKKKELFVCAEFRGQDDWVESDCLTVQNLILSTSNGYFKHISIFALNEEQVLVDWDDTKTIQQYDGKEQDDMIVDIYVCGKTMNAVLLLKKNTDGQSCLRMVLVDLHPEPRDLTKANHPTIKKDLEQSFDVSNSWPNSDPSFFQAAAVAFIARNIKETIATNTSRRNSFLEKKNIFYQGSFEKLRMTRSFENTLTAALNIKKKVAHAQFEEEKKKRRLQKGSDNLPTSTSDIFDIALLLQG